MTAKTIGQRVRDERESYGWSRTTLAAKAKMSSTALSDLELGYTKKGQSLHALARALHRRVEWLETGRGPKLPAEEDEGWADITAYGQSAAAGDGMAPEEYAETHSLKFKRSSLQRKGLYSRRLSIFYARGDSMNPRIHDGDALLFDTEDVLPRDGSIYIVKLDGEYLVKRLHKYGDHWFLVSENQNDPKWRRPVEATLGDGVEIIGRVRWIGSWED